MQVVHNAPFFEPFGGRRAVVGLTSGLQDVHFVSLRGRLEIDDPDLVVTPIAKRNLLPLLALPSAVRMAMPLPSFARQDEYAMRVHVLFVRH